MATVTQRGSAWRVQVRRKGVKAWQTFGTEAEAIAWGEAEEARISRAADGKPSTPIAPAGQSVADLMDRYAREVSPKKRGERWEAIRLRKLAPDFQMAAATLDKETIAEWRDQRLQQVSASSVNRELTLISAVITHAMHEWRLLLQANPVHLIKRPPRPEGRTRRVPDEDRAAIMKQLGWTGEQAPITRKQWVAWGFCLALETMMRQSEIFRLTWQHIHLAKKFGHLPETKNGYKRDVPLSSRARALLALLSAGEGAERVLPMNAGTFGLYFRAAVKASGVTDMHFHDSRRESLTRMAEKLPNVAELARASGHRGDLRSLMIYYHPTVTSTADKLD
jgi:integrase